MSKKSTILVLRTLLIWFALATGLVQANGGPFTIKYPNGDPAAKGVLARLDPDLKPGRENRLRVIKENLKVIFGKDGVSRGNVTSPPLVQVSAEYTIENPTDDQVEMDFGFPILRGVYINPWSMMISPAVKVWLDKTPVQFTIISNSAIYGIIRQRACEVIDKAIAANPQLSTLIAAVRDNDGQNRSVARQEFFAHLTESMKWSERDATLLVEYASLNVANTTTIHPRDRGWLVGLADEELRKLENQYLGPLAAIGEQKATQLFAYLASRFDPQAATTYEKIFSAWGGDVRECSVDLKTGKIRPREVTVAPEAISKGSDVSITGDPTIYARVDYLDPQAPISESERTSCEVILKNLPVIFTFAPMNILHYQVKFPAKSVQMLTVSYSQYAYLDTRQPSSYQLAYVVHPASLWQQFGSINLEVAVPDGVDFRASVACDNGGTEERGVGSYDSGKGHFSIYRAILEQKTGELYLAVDAKAWKNKVAAENQNNPVQQSAHLAIAGVKPNN